MTPTVAQVQAVLDGAKGAIDALFSAGSPAAADIDAVLDTAKAQVHALYAADVIAVHAGDDLAAVVAGAPAGATLVVDAGATFTLTGTLVLDKPLTIQGGTITLPNHALEIVSITGPQVTLDRVTLLGDPVKGQKRGIAIRGDDWQVLGCTVQDCFLTDQDTQAVFVGAGTKGLLKGGTFFGGAETLLIGGEDPPSADRIPAQIVVQDAVFGKKLEWRGLGVNVKNAFEVKNVKGLTVTNCQFFYSWVSGQTGHLLLLTVRNQDGTAPFSTIEDVVIQDCQFAHGVGAMVILGHDDQFPSQRMARVTIQRCTFADVDPLAWGGDESDKLIQIGNGPVQLTVDGNAFDGQHLGSDVFFYGDPCQALTLTNNHWPKAAFGEIIGDGHIDDTAWAAYTDAASVRSGNTVV